MGIEFAGGAGGIATNEDENNALTDEVLLELEGSYDELFGFPSDLFQEYPLGTELQISGAADGVSDGLKEDSIDDPNEGQSKLDDLYGGSLDLSIDQLNEEDPLGLSLTGEERIDTEIEDENDELK